MNTDMKVVILAGGMGTRLEEETTVIPKPLVKVGGYPILWHIMKIYSHYGFNDFVICLGYKGYLIKEYFANYFLHQSDVTFDYTQGEKTVTIHKKNIEPWKVTLVDTGYSTETGGRIKRIQEFVKDEPFLLTYGDGVSDINIPELVDFHKAHGKFATVTAVQPPGKYGTLGIAEDSHVDAFSEKPEGGEGWISGGFFVLEPAIFDFIDGDKVYWEVDPLKRLTTEGQLMAYHHNGFWKCMDTLLNKRELQSLWKSENPPWKLWED